MFVRGRRLFHFALSKCGVYWRAAFKGGNTVTVLLYSYQVYTKGPVKLIKRVKIAHSFLQCARSVPRYHFKLA